MAPEVHFEPFLHLIDVGAEEALVGWGGFYFRRGDSPYGEWRIVDDEELREVAGERTGTIGLSSEPYGEAVVEVERGGEVVARVETAEANYAWIRDLVPGTEYTYRVLVDGQAWAEGELWDWDLERRTLAPAGRRYENRFRTFPATDADEPIRFAVLGDFGVGILTGDENAQRQIGLARALERACDHGDVLLVLTTGDNVYLGKDTTGSGNEDDDWYASFYEPYRYVINRVPVFPTVGNHDVADTESSDDRDQLDDNFYLRERFRPGVEAGRASLDPGLFYCLRVGAEAEFICIDTSLAGEIGREHFFDDPAHAEWVERALHAGPGVPRWRIPFSHHPPFCAGPEHGNTTGMVERLVPMFEQAGVRLVLSGHEHNFQHAQVDGIDYVVSGAAGKLRTEPPTGFGEAGTRAWAAAGHILLVDLDKDRALVHPVTGVADDGSLEEIELRSPDGESVRAPIEVRR
ncbi:MAG TPA: metallophosphoesterase [Solirubrobacterales bacterium]|nr:metallophosphoesterase [Solirubrobacterales bacterium]